MDYRHSQTSEALRRAQRYAEALGAPRFTPEHLLAALATEPLVLDALGSVGIHAKDVLAAVGVGGEGSPACVYPDKKSQELLRRATKEAHSREHFLVEPGHLLLAIAGEKKSSAYRVLHALGAKPAELYSRLVALLPMTEQRDEELRETMRSLPRLSLEEMQNLARTVARRNRVLRLMRRDEKALDQKQRAEVEWLKHTEKGATLRLHRGHAYLMLAAAEQCAGQGHRLHYALSVADQAQLKAATEYSDSSQEFKSFSQRYISAALAKHPGCAVEW